VLDFLVARYGEFVLLKPRFEGQTALLWLTPLAVLMLGATAMVVAMRRRNRIAGPSDAKLSASEEARISELMSPRGE
jgi:cytochrome c-type biogenesis protein CcmH